MQLHRDYGSLNPATGRKDSLRHRTNKHHLTLSDATWDERTAVIILIACVAALGMAPWWISGMIGDSVLPITDLFTI